MGRNRASTVYSDWMMQQEQSRSDKKDLLDRIATQHHEPLKRKKKPADAEYTTDPPLKDQVMMLVSEVAKLTVQVDKLEEEKKVHHNRVDILGTLVGDLTDQVKALTSDLDMQIDELHQQLADLWESEE